MRRAALGTLALVLGVLAASASADEAPAPAGEDAALESAAARLGYSIGYQVGSDFRRQGLPLDPALVIEAVRDALAGAEPRLAPAAMREALVELERRARSAAEGGAPPQP